MCVDVFFTVTSSLSNALRGVDAIMQYHRRWWRSENDVFPTGTFTGQWYAFFVAHFFLELIIIVDASDLKRFDVF